MKKTNSDEKLVEQYTPRDPGLIARYLSVKPYKMKTLTRIFPMYKKALFCKAVSEVVKTHEERVSFDLYYGSVIPVSAEHLEVGREINEELMTQGYRLILKDDIRLAVNIYQDWYGDMHLGVSYAIVNAVDSLAFVDSVVKYMKENNFYIGEKIDVNGKFLDIEDVDFNAVVLPEGKKKSIKVGALDFFKKKEIYEQNKIPFKRGLIFTGVPGTGKTLTGRILMNKSECTFLWVTADMVQESRDVKRIFSMAKELTPCILFMEDIDDFLEKTDAVDVMKTQMDGMDGVSGICTILCTNFPEKLPLALIDRPSRFDEVIIFELPDLELRYSILNQVGEPMDIENRETVLKAIAKETEGLTGAHLKEIMVYALLLSADEERDTITENDLEIALKKVKDTKNTVTEGLRQVNVKCLVKELGDFKKSMFKKGVKDGK